MKPFKSKKAIWWSVGFSTLVLGVLVYGVFVPYLVKPYDGGAPEVDVPSMRNVPDNPGALRLDVQDSDEKRAQPKQQ